MDTDTEHSATIPRDTSIDATLALFNEGYNFISRRCRRLGSDVFETRLKFSKVICISGAAAAEMFYGQHHFTRQGAIPRSTLRLLQDKGSVQTLDDAAHAHRKALFMTLMTPPRIASLCDCFAQHWRKRLRAWSRQSGRIVLLHEAQKILCAAACDWSGVPVDEKQLRKRSFALAAMIANAGSLGPRNWWASVVRIRTEHWLRRLIMQARRGEIRVREHSALHILVWFRDESGKVLDVNIAAVELLNLLRPMVAVANYIVYAALALHEHPQWRWRYAAGNDQLRTSFVQEVRRHFPFFPFIGGRAKEAFDWNGYHFEVGDWVILDIYGTNHDPRFWSEPERFQPERFANWNGDDYAFIPQGGGDYRSDHRCPGEAMTIELVKTATTLLSSTMKYEVPPQDLSIDLGSIPALPKSGFAMENIRVMAEGQ